MPHRALLETWIGFGPEEDAAALEFIRRFFSHRGIDAWEPAAELPPFALISEGEPFTLLVAALDGPDGPRAARTRAMALLMTLEHRLRGGEREMGALIIPAPAGLAALVPLLPPLRRLLLPAGFGDAPGLVRGQTLRLPDTDSGLASLAAAADALLAGIPGDSPPQNSA